MSLSEVVEVTDSQELLKILSENDKVAVDFYATWCQPCKKFRPTYEAAAASREDVKFVAVDVDKAPWAMTEYNVRSVPTIVYSSGDEMELIKTGPLPAFLEQL